MKNSFLTSSALETKQISGALAPLLKRSDVILFCADLGAGKTTFIQGLVKNLKVPDGALSPTFVMIQTYEGRLAVHHVDFYRMNKKDLLSIGFQDYLSGSGDIERGVLLVEWADRFPFIWPEEFLLINIRHTKRQDVRRFSLRAKGPRYKKLMQTWLKKISR